MTRQQIIGSLGMLAVALRIIHLRSQSDGHVSGYSSNNYYIIQDTILEMQRMFTRQWGWLVGEKPRTWARYIGTLEPAMYDIMQFTDPGSPAYGYTNSESPVFFHQYLEVERAWKVIRHATNIFL